MTQMRSQFRGAADPSEMPAAVERAFIEVTGGISLGQSVKVDLAFYRCSWRKTRQEWRPGGMGGL